MKKARVNVDPEGSISNTTCEVCGCDTHSVCSIVVHSLSEVIHRRNGAPRWLVQVHFHVISYSKQQSFNLPSQPFLRHLTTHAPVFYTTSSCKPQARTAAYTNTLPSYPHLFIYLGKCLQGKVQIPFYHTSHTRKQIITDHPSPLP